MTTATFWHLPPMLLLLLVKSIQLPLLFPVKGSTTVTNKNGVTLTSNYEFLLGVILLSCKFPLLADMIRADYLEDVFPSKLSVRLFENHTNFCVAPYS